MGSVSYLKPRYVKCWMFKDIFLISSCLLAHTFLFPPPNSPLWSLFKAVNLVFLVIITLLFHTSFISSYSFKLNYIIRVIDTIATKGFGSWDDCFLVTSVSAVGARCAPLSGECPGLWVTWGGVGSPGSPESSGSLDLQTDYRGLLCEMHSSHLSSPREALCTSIQEEWNGGFRAWSGWFELRRASTLQVSQINSIYKH